MNIKKIAATAVTLSILTVGIASVGAQDTPVQPSDPNTTFPAGPREGFGPRGGQGFGPRAERPGDFRGELHALVEEYTGLTSDEVREALMNGSTLAELLGENVDAFIADAIAQAEARIDEAVANGNLDAERAERMKAELEQRITDRVNGVKPEGRPGKGQGRPFFNNGEDL